MKRLLSAIFLLLTVCPLIHGQTRTTVTGVVQTPTGITATSGYVEFRIRPSSSSLAYRVAGLSVIAPQTSRCAINASGNVVALLGSGACLLWGNTVILPASTGYDVVFAPNGTISSTIQNELISGTTYDLSNPVFNSSINIVPQYQTITTAPIGANLVPAANKQLNLGDSGHYYGQGYIDSLFSTTASISGSVTAGSLNNRIACAVGAGTVDSKFSTAAAQLPSTGGYVDCSNLQGPQTVGADTWTSQTKPITLIWPSGTVSSSVSLSFPQTMTIEFTAGGVLSMATATTATVNGEIRGTLSQHFAGSGNVAFNTSAAMTIYPEWFGAIADGVTDNQAAIQKSITAFTGNTNPFGGNIGPSGGGWKTLRFGAGTYLYKTGFTIAQSGVHLQGAGASSTILRFVPTSGGLTGISLNAGSQQLHDMQIDGMTLDAYGSSTAVTKTALWINDVGESNFTNLRFIEWNDTTHASLCLNINGRDELLFENIVMNCNRPVEIGPDNNASNQGLDTTVFHNFVASASLGLAGGQLCVTDKPVINITQANSFLTNVSFTDFDFICGSSAWYYTATNAKTAGSNNVSFQHGRTENQGVAQTGWTFYHAPPSSVPTFGLSFEDVSVQTPGLGGWFLRSVANGRMENNSYQSTATVASVDADSTAHMGFRNNNWNAHTAGQYTAFNGWCGDRYGEDASGSTFSTGQTKMRSCGTASLVMEPVPAGTAYTVSTASCSGYLVTVTMTTTAPFAVGGRITLAGITPSGFNGTFDIASTADASHATVVNDQCPLTYSSGGSLTYGSIVYISTDAVLPGQTAGDLAIRADGKNVLIGTSGSTTATFASSGTVTFAGAGVFGNLLRVPNATYYSSLTTGGVQTGVIGINGSDHIQISPSATTVDIGGGLLLTANPVVGGAGTFSIGNLVVAPGAGLCPVAMVGGIAIAGCSVVTVAGTTRYIPFF